MTLPVASVVTEKTLTEFNLLKLSLEQYHDCEWFISCDQIAYNSLINLKNLNCLKLIETDDCDHNVGSSLQKDNFMQVVMTKFDAAKAAHETHGSCLFLDSDMVFVNPFEEEILSLFQNKHIDAVITQHMTNNWQIEAKHGLYNAGMWHVKNLNFINNWIELSKNYKKYNFYFEQQPLEYVQRNYISLNLPINYNIGWWRFNTPQTKQRLEKLIVANDKIYFGNRPAINFHAHTSRKLDSPNYGQFLVDKIKILFDQTNNKNYKKLLDAMYLNNYIEKSNNYKELTFYR
jgi:hypothetical protein